MTATRSWIKRCMAALFALPVAGGLALAQDFPNHEPTAAPTPELRRLEYPADEYLEPSALGVSEASTDVRFVVAADEMTLEERLATLEKAYNKDKDAAAKKKADDAKKPTMKIAGRIHLDYWGFPDTSPGANAFETGNPAVDPVDRFAFRRVRIGVAGDIPDNMLYKIEMEFATPESPAFKDVFIGWKELPVLRTLLIGNQKRPYGLDHLNSSRYNVFMERPFIVEAFNQDARRLGIASYGLSEDEAWNWRFGVYNMEDMQSTGAVLGDHYQPELAGRLANTVWYDEASDGRGYAHWAVSGTWADTNLASPAGNSTRTFRTRPEARTSNRWLNTQAIPGLEEYSLLGLEGLVNLGPLQVCGEWMQNWCERQNGLEDLQFHGGYVYVSYFLTGEHLPWDRESGTLGRVKPLENFFLVNTCDSCVRGGWGAWQVAARVSRGDLSDDGVLGGIGNSFTLGMNWHWNPNARVQFNYIYGKVDDHFPVAGQTDGIYNIFGVRWMIDY